MLQKLFARTFELTFAGLVIAALLSLLSFFSPIAHAVILFSILAATLILGLWKFEIAFAILLAELFAGSQGRLFSAGIGGFSLSLRMGLFAVVLLLWVLFRSRHDIRRVFSTPISWWLSLLILVTGLGILVGLMNDNSARSLYLDVNGMLYLLGGVLFFSAVRSRAHIPQVLQILAAALAFSALFALALFIIFSHGSQFVPEIYRWVRDARMFEITGLGGRYYRIFSQAHIFALLGGLVFAGLFAGSSNRHERRNAVIVMVIAGLLLVVGFSRSFLAAAFASYVVLLLALTRRFRWSARRILGFVAATILIIALNVALLFTIAATVGKTGVQVSLNALEKRVTDGSQPGVSSRYGLFRPLLTEGLKRPFIGAGWGTTITYQTSDPRIIASSGGSYTTFAFEWGYLDFFLKLGLLGLVVIVGLLFALIREQRRLLRQPGVDVGFITGLGCAIIALFLTHAVTPFLNHPTGIGFLLLTAAILLTLRKPPIPDRP